MNAPPTSTTAFALWRLHSLTGTIPLGAFLIVHLLLVGSAVDGQAAFDATSTALTGAPGRLAIEIGFIYAPLGYHAGYGMFRMARAESNLGRHDGSANWAYTLQRISGIITLCFIVVHLFEYRIPLALGEIAPTDFYQVMLRRLSSTTSLGFPLVAVGYLVAVAASSFHFANGMRRACLTWGLVRSEPAQARLRALCTLIGVLLFISAVNSVLYLATGAPLFVSAIQGSRGLC